MCVPNTTFFANASLGAVGLTYAPGDAVLSVGFEVPIPASAPLPNSTFRVLTSVRLSTFVQLSAATPALQT